MMLDPRRRLVIVRCDGREHLLLLSPAGDRVVSEWTAAPMEPAQEESKA